MNLSSKILIRFDTVCGIAVLLRQNSLPDKTKGANRAISGVLCIGHYILEIWKGVMCYADLVLTKGYFCVIFCSHYDM